MELIERLKQPQDYLAPPFLPGPSCGKWHPKGTLTHMAAEIVPSAKGSKEATFACLAKDFNLDDKVLALLMKSPMDNLEDFRFYFSEEKEVDAFVAQEATLKDQLLRIQVSRLRRAWASVRQMALRREARQSTSTVAELDDLLCEVDLRNAKV